MEVEANRLGTFKDFPNNDVSAIRLAAAGYYATGNRDEVACFSCSGRHSNWKRGDDPMTIHRRRNPQCGYLSTVNLKVPTASQSTSNQASAFGLVLSFSAMVAALMQSRTASTAPGQSEDHSADPRISSFDDRQNGNISFQRPSLASNLRNQSPETTQILETDRPGQREQQQEQRRQQEMEQQRQHQHQLQQNQLSQQRHQQLMQQQQQREQHQHDQPPRLQMQQPAEQQQSSHPNQQQQQQRQQQQQQQQQQLRADGSGGRTQDLLNIHVGRPAFPSLAVPVQREQTFLHWPRQDVLDFRRLSDAGFFYSGDGDGVRCFHCSGGLKNWLPTDEPWVEHARWFPRCTFLRQCKGDLFVATVHALTDRQEVVTMEEVEAKMQVENDAKENEGGDLERQTEEMKEEMRCKVCLEREVSIVFLPCGHLVACPVCAPALPRCPVCRRHVKASVKAYMS